MSPIGPSQSERVGSTFDLAGWGGSPHKGASRVLTLYWTRFIMARVLGLGDTDRLCGLFRVV